MEMNFDTGIDYHHDYQSGKIGMWLFLFTELLLFGGMFIAFAVYFYQYPEAFKLGSGSLNVVVGAVNTISLLASSLTVVLAITAIQRGNKNFALINIFMTIAMAFAFLVNKYFEWSAKIHHGIYPNSPTVLEMEPGKIIYYGLYYMMTGVHALHIIIGIVVLTVVFFMIKSDKINKDDFNILENSGLYWHLVDLIWIFLFPLFYLIR